MVPGFGHHQTGIAQPVGRDHEHRVLSAGYDAASVGNGRLFLVGGEAGIGKSTLVEHFVADALAAEATVITGACYDVTSPPAYSPWRETFSSARAAGQVSLDRFDDQYLSSLPDQSALFNEIRQRLEHLASRCPLVLVLEDLHWSDHESLELLRFVARSIRNSSMLIIATYRNDEITSEHPLYHMLPTLVREARAERIELRRFSRPTISEMVETRYHLEQHDHDRIVDDLERRTEGNPFFITELLRSMEMSGVIYQESGRFQLATLFEIEIPPLVRQVIDRRFLGLDQPARQALQVAAVIGHDIRPALWLATIDEDEVGLSSIVQQAMDAFLLEQSPHRTHLRFRHALIQEALYSSLPLPWRQLQHRRIAAELARQSDADPAVIATHFLNAGDSRAVHWLLAAARVSQRLSAAHAVIQHIDTAFGFQAEMTNDQHIEAHRLRGWAREITGQFDEADRDYQLALLAGRQSGSELDVWDALVRLGELWAGRDYRKAGDYVEQALHLAEEIGDHALTAYSLNRLGNWHLNNEDPDRARDCHDRALEMFQQIGDQPGIATTEDLLGMTLLMGGNLIEAASHYERAIHHFQILDDQKSLSSSLANISHCGLIYQTETMPPANTTLTECQENVERALKTAEEIDFRAAEVYALLRLGSILGARGEYQAALDAVERSVSSAEEINHRQWLCAAHSVGGLLQLDMLEPEPATDQLERALAIAREIGSSVWVRSISALRATAQLARGKLDKAIAALDPVWSKDLSPRTMAQHHVWRARIELELNRNDPVEAIRLIDAVIDSTPHTSKERPAVRLCLLRSRALFALEEYDEAESWLLPARTVARVQGARPLLWRVHRDLGVVKVAQGKRLSATDEFSEAHRLIDEIGATLTDPESRTRFLTSAHGEIPEGWAPTLLQSAKRSFGGLTRRQREVAALIAAGSSNREIADSLSISERTVETHITAIFSTLALNSRAQLTAWCVEIGLVERQRP